MRALGRRVLSASLCSSPCYRGAGRNRLLTFPLIGRFKATGKLGAFLEPRFLQSFWLRPCRPFIEVHASHPADAPPFVGR
jgi:hypothetical protein